jgi:hypothetical protein
MNTSNREHVLWCKVADQLVASIADHATWIGLLVAIDTDRRMLSENMFMYCFILAPKNSFFRDVLRLTASRTLASLSQTRKFEWKARQSRLGEARLLIHSLALRGSIT